MTKKSLFTDEKEEKLNIWKLAFIMTIAAIICLATHSWHVQAGDQRYQEGMSDMSINIITTSAECKRVDLINGNLTAMLIDVRCLKLPEAVNETQTAGDI